MTRTSMILSAILLVGSLPAQAQEGANDRDTEERIEELENQIEVLTEEVQEKRQQQSPASGALAGGPVEGNQGGISHFASKVYTKDRGLSIGGYGQSFYRNRDDGLDTALPLRQILYVGYRFNDWLVLNTELEFETEVEREEEEETELRDTDADGQFDTVVTEQEIETEREHEAELEFANVDFLLDPRANIRAGLVLLPLGIINEEHEPPTYFGNRRPELAQTILPTTMRENAAGVYGELSAANLQYVAYVTNGFDAAGLSGETAEEGLGDVKQDGAAFAENLSFTGSVEWSPLIGTKLGVSGLHGDADQTNFFNNTDVPISVWDIHGEWKRDGLWVRGVFAQAHIGDTRLINNQLGLASSDDVVPETMRGWYLEGGYDVFRFVNAVDSQQKLYPWVRYSHIDTQEEVDSGFRTDPSNERNIITGGLHYQPHPQVSVKAEVRSFSSDGPENNQEEFLVGVGYNF